MPLRVQRRGVKTTLNQRQYSLSQSLEYLVRYTPWPEVPAGPLVAIADGMVKYLDKQWHSWYFILVRPVDDDKAILLPPHHQATRELAPSWTAAFAAVPDDVRERIVALVSDGHRGLTKAASHHGWLHQRCHFHHLKRLQAQRSRWQTGRHRTEAEALYVHTKAVLTHPDHLEPHLEALAELARTSTSREIRKVVSGFLTSYQDYRTYLEHPELNLPTTTNTAESFVGLVRDMSRRARGFRSVRTFNKWIIALVKTKKTIHCRGFQAPKRPQN